MAEEFDPKELSNLYKSPKDSSKGDNGQVTIIGGSSLFHGAPLFALTIASRIVDMVFFASPESSLGKVANEVKSKLFSFIWTPWEEIDSYIEKSDACLIGSGLMRSAETREITRQILNKFQDKRWVIDAGSLQMMERDWIPENSILTPNQKEYKILFGEERPETVAKKYKCILVLKGPTTIIYSSNQSVEVHGGNAGLTKGGTGDVEAGLTVALIAKNDPFLSACAASYIVKATADDLFNTVGTNYNSDDLAKKIPEILFRLSK